MGNPDEGTITFSEPSDVQMFETGMKIGGTTAISGYIVRIDRANGTMVVRAMPKLWQLIWWILRHHLRRLFG